MIKIPDLKGLLEVQLLLALQYYQMDLLLELPFTLILFILEWEVLLDPSV